ncbi:hypothetical protein MA16_Dca019935 [Dendrobium catenatum]|uniref:Reverse transcriptase domain-containing protein n=1 Tax=Dendrobium catenatum TaxID=906689 RepID=A0A2I0VN69_9ASPA|nr:hypothetical protein MA16_Dca019935 [Dendrobium catenatum]
MRILKWNPFFDVKEESPIVPIWISFPNLRLHFFNTKVLDVLGLIFGHPLQTDQATASRTRPSVARVLVEVDITKKYANEVWVGSKTLGYLQKVEFEKVPDFCNHYKSHGHALSECFKLRPELKKTPNNSAFTWYRSFMWQRLDRILFNKDWISNFNMTQVHHLSRTLSDHAPLLMLICENNTKASFAFRFQNMLITHSDFLNVVAHNWNAIVFPDNNIVGMDRLWDKLSRLKQTLRWWNKYVFKNIFDNIKEAEGKVLELETSLLDNHSDDNLSNLDNAKHHLFHLQNQEEIFWKQKTAISWSTDGDRNTIFFHALVNKNRIRNHIHKMVDPQGNVYDTEKLVFSSGIDYFKEVFNYSKLNIPIVNANVIPKIMDEDENLLLTQLPTEDEVWNNIKDMNGDSVDGPDGFTIKFFVKTWDIIKLDVIDAVHDFFKGTPYPKFFLSTNIVLIPKEENTTYWNEFILISLCTFFNILVAKINASRISFILPKIISINQTEFVKGRSIFDNILLAQDMVHDLNAKVTGGNILFKLDITKAYDNLKWDFLYKVLHLLGFNDSFLMLIKNSIENFFFIIINGNNYGFFLPKMV